MIDSLSDDFFKDIKTLQNNGAKPIIIHGGGPAINKLLNELNIKSEFVNGLRKTTLEVMKVVEMVLSGSITNQLVRALHKHDLPSIGLSGFDDLLLQAKAQDMENLGYVGEITQVNKEVLLDLLKAGKIPVISPIAAGVDGAESYNINADTAAAAIAVAVQAKKLLFVTDVPGVMKDGAIIEEATTNEILALIEDGTISGGMIPKVMAAVDSLIGGMTEAMIVSGHAHLLEGTKLVGTTIRKEMEAVN